ncbi:hypothetical protein ACWCXH_39405 [Kitasatospora sp. NPDC001660]
MTTRVPRHDTRRPDDSAAITVPVAEALREAVGTTAPRSGRSRAKSAVDSIG